MNTVGRVRTASVGLSAVLVRAFVIQSLMVSFNVFDSSQQRMMYLFLFDPKHLR